MANPLIADGFCQVLSKMPCKPKKLAGRKIPRPHATLSEEACYIAEELVHFSCDKGRWVGILVTTFLRHLELQWREGALGKEVDHHAAIPLVELGIDDFLALSHGFMRLVLEGFVEMQMIGQEGEEDIILVPTPKLANLLWGK